jgi:hypothetical protein
VAIAENGDGWMRPNKRTVPLAISVKLGLSALELETKCALVRCRTKRRRHWSDRGSSPFHWVGMAPMRRQIHI